MGEQLQGGRKTLVILPPVIKPKLGIKQPKQLGYQGGPIVRLRRFRKKQGKIMGEEELRKVRPNLAEALEITKRKTLRENLPEG